MIKRPLKSYTPSRLNRLTLLPKCFSISDRDISLSGGLSLFPFAYSDRTLSNVVRPDTHCSRPPGSLLLIVRHSGSFLQSDTPLQSEEIHHNAYTILKKLFAVASRGGSLAWQCSRRHLDDIILISAQLYISPGSGMCYIAIREYGCRVWGIPCLNNGAFNDRKID